MIAAQFTTGKEMGSGEFLCANDFERFKYKRWVQPWVIMSLNCFRSFKLITALNSRRSRSVHRHFNFKKLGVNTKSPELTSKGAKIIYPGAKYEWPRNTQPRGPKCLVLIQKVSWSFYNYRTKEKSQVKALFKITGGNKAAPTVGFSYWLMTFLPLGLLETWGQLTRLQQFTWLTVTKTLVHTQRFVRYYQGS